MVEHATYLPTVVYLLGRYYGAFCIGCVHMGIALNSRPHMSCGIN